MKRLFLAATATGLLMALNASATLVANFESSGAWVPARARNVNTNTEAIWNYSDSNLLLNDASGQSGKIYGGVKTSWSVSQPSFPTLYVLKNPNDGFVVQVSPTDNTGTQSIKGAYLWSKADFLNGVSDTVQLNAGNSISFNFDWMTAAGNQELRLIVKQGGVTYISEWWTSGYQNISHDPSTTQWAVFDTTNYTWGAFSPLTLDDIEGAGVYYTLSITGATCAARLNDFQIDATIVPAPGTDEVVVDFSPSAVFAGGRAVTTSTDNGDTWAYSDTIPLLNDTDETAQNGRIYGGVTTTWSVAQDYQPYVLKAANQGFLVQNWVANGSDTSITAVYLWDKADFLSGSSDIVQFNAVSNVTYNFEWLTYNLHQLRLVAKQGGIVYVSEWSTTNTLNVSKNPTTTNWAVLNTTDYTWGAFSPVTFDDIEGVGIYYTIARTADNSAARMDAFQVTARVVPAPVGENYADWASSQVPPVTGGENGDDDNDGVKNLVQYALVDGGGRGELSGNTITFTKRGAPYGGDLTYIIETSETLDANSWTAAVTHGPAELGSPISYDLAPAPGTPKKFARLKAVKTP